MILFLFLLAYIFLNKSYKFYFNFYEFLIEPLMTFAGFLNHELNLLYES